MVVIASIEAMVFKKKHAFPCARSLQYINNTKGKHTENDKNITRYPNGIGKKSCFLPFNISKVINYKML